MIEKHALADREDGASGNSRIRLEESRSEFPARAAAASWTEPHPTALLVLADGTLLEGFELGATGHAVGEVCFNTAMTGYQEILTDPSYAGQIITFTFPHIGNVGTNEEDIENSKYGGNSGSARRRAAHCDNATLELPRHAALA